MTKVSRMLMRTRMRDVVFFGFRISLPQQAIAQTQRAQRGPNLRGISTEACNRRREGRVKFTSRCVTWLHLLFNG